MPPQHKRGSLAVLAGVLQMSVASASVAKWSRVQKVRSEKFCAGPRQGPQYLKKLHANLVQPLSWSTPTLETTWLLVLGFAVCVRRHAIACPCRRGRTGAEAYYPASVHAVLQKLRQPEGHQDHGLLLFLPVSVHLLHIPLSSLHVSRMYRW